MKPADIWRRLTSLGKMTPLQRASIDLAETERQRYEVARQGEELAAVSSMLEKRERALRTLITSLNQETSREGA